MLCSRQFSRAFILLALVAATTALQPGDQPVDYKKVCTALGPYSPMRGVGLKPIETQQFCSTSGLDSNPQKCLLLDATEGALIKGYESQGTACHEEKQTAANAKSPSGTISEPMPTHTCMHVGEPKVSHTCNPPPPTKRLHMCMCRQPTTPHPHTPRLELCTQNPS